MPQPDPINDLNDFTTQKLENLQAALEIFLSSELFEVYQDALNALYVTSSDEVILGAASGIDGLIEQQKLIGKAKAIHEQADIFGSLKNEIEVILDQRKK